MAVFYSFYYRGDAMRVQQIIQMGALEGQRILVPQDWQSVKRQGEVAIRNWIDAQMKYKTAVVVLIGEHTASRPWVQYEIIKAWHDRRPMLGVRIHRLPHPQTGPDRSGANPFRCVRIKGGGTAADHVPVYSPEGSTSAAVHASIRMHLKSWSLHGYKRP